jgi:hypothetical protein
MGGSPKPEQADTVSGLDAGYTKAAKTDNAGAQQRGGAQIVELIGKAKNEIGASHGKFGVAAVDRVTGKGRGIAEVFQAQPAIAAGAVGSSHPGNADAGADGKVVRGPGHYLADNLMSGDDSGATGWQVAFDDMQIGAANSTHTHPQKNLTRLRLGCSNLANPKRALMNFLRQG